ncbi:hypothetical protein VPH35_088034 [Triticum aestivum]
MASDEASWRLAGENRWAIVGKAPAIDRMTKKKKKTRSKGLPQAAPTAGKRLLPYEEIMTILSMKDEPRKSDTAEDKKVVAKCLEFQEEVKREDGNVAKGYMEMDEEDFVEREKRKLLLKEAWDKIDFGGLVFLDSDDDNYVVKDQGDPHWADGIVQE